MIIATIVMAITGVALLQQWLVAVPRRACEDLLAAIRERGEPLRLSELAPAPAADEENAAVLYQQAFGLYRKPGPEIDEHLETLASWIASSVGPPPSQETLDAIASWLRSNEPVLTLMIRAAKRPRCVFPVDWSAGIDMSLDHLGLLRDITRLALTSADLALARGDPKASLAASQTALALPQALNEEPTLISMLVRCYMAREAMDRLAAALDAGARPTEKDASILARHLQNIDDSRTLERCLIGERAFGLDAFALLEGGNAPAGLGVQDDTAFYLYPHTLLPRDKLSYLSKMEAAIEAARTSPENQRAADLQDLVKKQTLWLGPHNFVTMMLLPAMGPAATRQFSLHQQARQLALDLAAIRYHTRHGSPPDLVETLVKEGLLEAAPLDSLGDPMELTPPATAEDR